jgi:hypothetical protein
MPATATTASPSEALRETNLRLLRWLDRMAESCPAESCGAGSYPPTFNHGKRSLASPEDIAALLSELMRTGASLRAHASPAGADPEFDLQLQRYREHVERLRAVLPSIHGQLLAERARLEAQRARVRSAAEWARASRQTL